MPSKVSRIVEFPLTSRASKVGKMETVTHPSRSPASAGAKSERVKPSPVDVGPVLHQKILLVLSHEKRTGGTENVRVLMEQLLAQTDLQERYEEARKHLPE